MSASTPAAKQPCPCGSGKPFRKCCGKKPSPTQRALSGAAVTPRLIGLADGRTLPSGEAFQEGMSLHRAGRYRRAAEIYRALLSVAPKHADALHLLGVAERQMGNFATAIDLIRRAIDINPGAALYFSNLAEAYRARGKGPEAETAARRALALNAGLPEAHLNLGAALHLQRNYTAAITAYRRALQLNPQLLEAAIYIGDALLASGACDEALAAYQRLRERHPDNSSVLSRIGIGLRRAKQFDAAIRHYHDCITRQPQVSEYHNNLAQVYMQTGRKDEAAASLRRHLELTPGDAGARHLLNALEGKTTERAPTNYVRDLFDQYADTFESHLVKKLAYRTPQLLGDILRGCMGTARDLAILDLGCGTGLMGEVLHDVGGHLVGVDISPKMIDKTLAKGLYQEAHAEDLLSFMQRSSSERFDTVIAADVFVYLGELREIFVEAARLLRPGGWFAFTVEATDAGETADFVLDSTGRFRHSQGYLRRLAETAGLSEAHFSQAVIRTQNGQPVPGYLCVFTRPRG